MDLEQKLQAGADLVKEWTISSNKPEINRIDLVIAPEHLKESVSALLDNQWGYLSAITGLDHPEYAVDETGVKQIVADKGNLELLYHFSGGAAVLTLRITLPYEHAVVDSICEIDLAAQLYEREAAELFGIEFTGAPSTDHLVLPDEWPVGVYPLRKSFTGLKKS
ncbi:NADH-quinone oxidoreductase subunit C [bacterium]|nr:MAG: NADH-quinone oxidoreductase subunit C [bacterium]